MHPYLTASHEGAAYASPKEENRVYNVPEKHRV
jgi:hypothetical protein